MAQDVERRLLDEIEAAGPRMELLSQRHRWARELRKRTRMQIELDVDTARVGRLEVVAPTEDMPDVLPVFQSIWDDVGEWVGSEGELEAATFIFDEDGKLRALQSEGDQYRVDLRRWSWGERLLSDDRLLERRIRPALGQHLRARLPYSMSQWLDPAALQAGAPEKLYRILVLTGAPSTESCLVGDVEGCWQALGLAPAGEYLDGFDRAELEATENGRWLLQMERECREAVPTRCWRRHWGVRPDGPWPGLYMPLYWSLAPALPSEARADLLHFALEQGGQGALDRLLESWPESGELPGVTDGSSLRTRVKSALPHAPEVLGDDDPGRDRIDREILEAVEGTGAYLPTFATGMREALAAASGMSQDELMAAWRERLVEARPDLQAGADRTRTTTFIWILFFTALAMRSTRWRLG